MNGMMGASASASKPLGCSLEDDGNQSLTHRIKSIWWWCIHCIGGWCNKSKLQFLNVSPREEDDDDDDERSLHEMRWPKRDGWWGRGTSQWGWKKGHGALCLLGESAEPGPHPCVGLLACNFFRKPSKTHIRKLNARNDSSSPRPFQIRPPHSTRPPTLSSTLPNPTYLCLCPPPLLPSPNTLCCNPI